MRVKDVIRAVSEVYDVSPQEITSPRQHKNKSLDGPRFLATWMAVELCPEMTFTQIGQAINRDHTSLLYRVKRAEKLLENNAAFRECYMQALMKVANMNMKRAECAGG